VKRSLTLLLASLLVIFGLTACGGSGDKPDQTDSAVVGGDTAGENGGTANNGDTNNGTANNGSSGAITGSDSANNSSNADNGTGTGTGDTLLDDAAQGMDDLARGARNALDDVTGTTRNSNAHLTQQNGTTRAQRS